MLPEDPKNFWILCIACTLFASIAGVLGYIMRSIDARVKIIWWVAVVQAVAAAFVGVITLLICIELGLSMAITGVCVGILGWMGANASMGVLTKFAFNKLGIAQHEPIRGRENDSSSTE